HLRLDRDAVLPDAHEGVPGRHGGQARTSLAVGANHDMTPPPRCRLAVAPRFHLEPDWAARLGVGTGVREVDGRFFPLGPWRPLTGDELPLLVSGPENDGEAGCLFQIPGHLRAAW